MKNAIRQFKDDQALTTALLSLQRDIENYKGGVQQPTTIFTPVSTITGSVYDSFANKGAGNAVPELLALATLTPPTSQFLLATPEVFIDMNVPAADPTLYSYPIYMQYVDNGSNGVNLIQSGLGGLIPAAGMQYLSYKWWFDLDSTLGNFKSAALLRLKLDASMYDYPPSVWSGLNSWNFAVRWRYMLFGSST